MIAKEKTDKVIGNNNAQNVDLKYIKRWNGIFLITITIFVVLSFFVLYIFRIKNMSIYNPYEIKIIQVSSEEKDWYLNENINLFKKDNEKGEKLIYPGESGNYNFVIKNDNSVPVKYRIIISEDNKYNINIRYRLKLNNIYIVGDENTYETIDKLNLNDITILEKTKGLYTLEWKWEDSDNDTELAKEGLVTYRIYIDIYSKYSGDV